LIACGILGRYKYMNTCRYWRSLDRVRVVNSQTFEIEFKGEDKLPLVLSQYARINSLL
jgi:hypothetical protein